MSGAHCMVNGNFCGETETLKIIKEFQKLYEDKLKKIDELENVDASELKIQMLQEWVRDLTDQNTMLVEAVEDLEREASDRVTLLEEKLQSSQAVYKALSTSTTGPPELPKIDNVKNNSETIQVKNLEADVKNLLEVIRRVRDEGIWSIKELTFYTINSDDIIENERSKATINTRNIENNQNKSQQNLQSLKDELQQTKEDLNKKIAENITLTEQIAKMEKSAKETRDALTAEVADKHDSVRALRHEYQNLEEQCRQLDQQTHFKEDIIKEMRKELRAMRSKYLSVMSKLSSTAEVNEPVSSEKISSPKSWKHSANSRTAVILPDKIPNKIDHKQSDYNVCKCDDKGVKEPIYEYSWKLSYHSNNLNNPEKGLKNDFNRYKNHNNKVESGCSKQNCNVTDKFSKKLESLNVLTDNIMKTFNRYEKKDN